MAFGNIVRNRIHISDFHLCRDAFKPSFGKDFVNKCRGTITRCELSGCCKEVQDRSGHNELTVYASRCHGSTSMNSKDGFFEDCISHVADNGGGSDYSDVWHAAVVIVMSDIWIVHLDLLSSRTFKLFVVKTNLSVFRAYGTWAI